MGAYDDVRVEKQEKGVLDRFKKQNLLLKEFGEDGIKLYATVSPEKSIPTLESETGLEEEKIIKILEFMEQNGIILVVKGSLREVDQPFVLPKQKPREQAANEEEKDEFASTSAPSDEFELKPMGYSTSSRTKEKEEENEAEEEPLKPSFEFSSTRKEAKPEPSPFSGPSNLSPLEKKIYSKFGKVGLTVYSLIDGQRTAEEILNETGISEVKLVEILEYMDKEGIIRLEKPQDSAKTEEAKKKA
ncbi:MAG: hypothetical protein ABIH99_04180, partial [Candidatus Micrarchaeota archaeon]